MTRAAGALMAMAALLGAAPAAAKKPAEPVALLPFFKADYETDRGFPWLDSAISMTMGDDLTAGDHIDLLGYWETRTGVADELYPDDNPIGYRRANSVEIAVRIGKRIGAGSVVFGTYEEPGGQIQLTASLVDVASGTVLRQARAEGLVNELFLTQDALLKQLFPGYRAPEKRRQVEQIPKGFRHAYGLYALAVTTRDDANGVRLLTKALESDPGFFYASDRLARIEKKARERAALARLSGAKLDKTLRKTFEANRVPSRNPNEQGYFFFDLLNETGYQKAILPLADRMYAMEWPEHDHFIRSNALYWKRRALLALKRNDEALRVGEQYLKEFPRERFYSVISRDNQSLARHASESQKSRDGLDAKLADLDQQLARVDRERCETFLRNDLYLRAVSECQSFAEGHRDAHDPDVQRLVHESRWDAARALASLGRFDEARTAADALIADAPAFATQRNLAAQVQRWPRD